ncbi:hypothetical protein BC826DRAFT_970288 [Russula brevipes]|nr:hypothetical protein BC826DRAFT_970288 [Russula brevipes]
MRVKSTLVIAFLVPILALLASVRAAPSSGLRSRDDLPLSIDWAGPVKNQKVMRGDTLTLGIFVRQKDPNSPPPYSVEFKLGEFIFTGWDEKEIFASLGTQDIGLSEDGSVSLYYVSIPADAIPTETMTTKRQRPTKYVSEWLFDPWTLSSLARATVTPRLPRLPEGVASKPSRSPDNPPLSDNPKRPRREALIPGATDDDDDDDGECGRLDGTPGVAQPQLSE